MDNLGNCINIKYDNIFRISYFKGWDNELFLKYCILCGCDYFKLKNMGSMKAIKFLKKMGNDINKWGLTKDEINNFNKAYITFKSQIIYCPLSKNTRNLDYITDINLIELELKENIYGYQLEQDKAQKIAKCIIDPITYIPFDDNYDDNIINFNYEDEWYNSS